MPRIPTCYLPVVILAVVISALHSSVSVADDLFIDGFESGKISPLMWQIDGGDNCEIAVVGNPVRAGNAAVDFTASKRARCELVPHTVRGKFARLKRKFLREPYRTDRWYVFSIYLHEPWQKHEKNEVLAQWHASPDPIIANEEGRGPPLALRVIDGYFRISYGWDKQFRSSDKNIAKYTLWYDDLVTGQWIDWIFQVRWSYESDGLIRVWNNGELIVDYKGPNAYNDLRGVYLKLGIYHPRPERQVTFDEIYIGDEAPASIKGSVDVY